MAYSYKYSPNSKAETWLKNQQNKSKSLDLLIEHAIDNFGVDDLYESAARQMLSTSSQNVTKPETTQDEIKTKIIESKIVEPEDVSEPKKPKSKPNVNFLSGS